MLSGRHRTALALLVVCSVCSWTGPAAANPVAPNPAAQAAAGEAMLLEFSAEWCAHCRQLAPLLRDVAAAGWVVRTVDCDRELDLVRRFGVSAVPCYVLVVKGHEVGRINGATTRGELEKLLARAATPLGGVAVAAAPRGPAQMPGMPVPTAAAAAPLAIEPTARANTPAAALAAAPAVAAALSRQVRPVTAPAPPRAEPAAAAPPSDERVLLDRRLLNATVRLRVDDGKGIARGTGTVIDCRQGEALILTCGHIFRDSQGQGRIEVDLFAPGGPRGVAGEVVSWDLQRDLALVSVFTDVPLEPVRVGGGDRRPAPGDAVISVGCDGGATPTVQHSKVTAIDRYLGPANVEVAGQPVQGRSGGGLFAADGTLIGVCSAADKEYDEGIFTALPAVHEQLDAAGLAFVYRHVYPGADAAVAGSPAMPAEMPTASFDRRPRDEAVPTASTDPAARPDVAAGADPSPGERALLDQVRRHQGRAEVICIVRPHGGSQADSEVYVLKEAGPGFVDRLSQVHQPAVRPAAEAGRADLARLPGVNPLR
jgi:thiol-disulfide isomerase/thioredoxin